MSHLAQGTVRFENLVFDFAAPYRTWLKARRHGIENRICRLAMARCRQGSVCVDVGANCGFISLVMASSLKGSGKVLSFEADSACFKVLQRNILANGLEGLCEPIEAFIGLPEREGQVSLDEMLTERGLNRLEFLKIDVDGGDLDVLRGSRKALNLWRPVVVVEMVANQREIYRFLRDEIGYVTLVGMSGEPVRPGAWPPNLIASDGPITIPPRGNFA